jgi:hypothetical protein
MRLEQRGFFPRRGIFGCAIFQPAEVMPETAAHFGFKGSEPARRIVVK